MCWWETNRTCHWAPGACLRSTAPAAPTLGVQLGRHWRGPPETRVSVTAAAVDGVATQYGCCSGSTAASRLGRTTCSAVQPHLVRPPAPVDEHRVYVNGEGPPGNTDYRAWPRTSCLPEHEVEEQARGQMVPLQISISPSPAVCCSQRPIID